MKLPDNVNEIWDALEAAGWEVFLVGGAVRDRLMKREPHDFDLATNARPDDIMSIFPDAHLDGETFPVVFVGDIEVATYRKEKYVGSGDKNVEISYADTIEEDLGRRDFTMNAMAMKRDGTLVDLYGGVTAIKMKVIRFVGDSECRIYEDPNRLLRGIRFAARFGFDYDPDAFETMINHGPTIVSEIAPERIRLEIIKTMESVPRASHFWFDLLRFGILDDIFPEMSDGWGHTGGKHHAETVWEHNMIAGDHIPTSKPLLKLTMYLHDIGKPQSWQDVIEHSDGTDTGFNGHEVIGEEMAKEHLLRLKFSGEEITFVGGLIRSHMRSLRDITPRARRRLFKALHEREVSWKNFILFKVADRKANLAHDDHTREEIKEMVNHFVFHFEENLPFSAHDLALSGGEIMTILGGKPGPIIGEVQRHLLEKVLEDGEEFNNKENLTKCAILFRLSQLAHETSITTGFAKLAQINAETANLARINGIAIITARQKSDKSISAKEAEFMTRFGESTWRI